MGGTKLREKEKTSTLKVEGTILLTHFQYLTQAFCSCCQVNDGLPQNYVIFLSQSLFLFEECCFIFHSGFAVYSVGVILALSVHTKVCNESWITS